jgi:hypothetical protein
MKVFKEILPYFTIPFMILRELHEVDATYIFIAGFSYMLFWVLKVEQLGD